MHTPKTEFAPAERSDSQNLQRQIRLLRSNELQLEIGDAVPLIVLVLNSHRQIIYSNKRTVELLGLADLNCVYGQRPGELLDCVRAAEGPGGCGTSAHCRNCGAVLAVLGALEGDRNVKECRLTNRAGASAEFRVTATPVERDGERFVFFTAEDIQHEKRRQALEGTFFHDILNTAGGVSGLIEILDEIESETERDEMFSLLKTASRRLVDEIQAGRVLSQAESGELRVDLKSMDIREVVSDMVDLYRNHRLCESRKIRYEEPSEPVRAQTDEFLLQRVAGNLIKNALEACPAGDTVSVKIVARPNIVELSVNNPGVMPLPVKQQMFQRSFSTKGIGRGIGTYSIRLFTENYLRGQVSFASEEPDGTTFRITLPAEGG